MLITLAAADPYMDGPLTTTFTPADLERIEAVQRVMASGTLGDPGDVLHVALAWPWPLYVIPGGDGGDGGDGDADDEGDLDGDLGDAAGNRSTLDVEHPWRTERALPEGASELEGAHAMISNDGVALRSWDGGLSVSYDITTAALRRLLIP